MEQLHVHGGKMRTLLSDGGCACKKLYNGNSIVGRKEEPTLHGTSRTSSGSVHPVIAVVNNCERGASLLSVALLSLQ